MEKENIASRLGSTPESRLGQLQSHFRVAQGLSRASEVSRVSAQFPPAEITLGTGYSIYFLLGQSDLNNPRRPLHGQ